MILLLIAIAGLMIVIERMWPGQALPTVKGWWVGMCGLACFTVTI
jgi:hypothetical protein